MRWVRYVACMVEKRYAFKFLAGKPRERDPWKTLSVGWEGNIKINLRKNMVVVCELDSYGSSMDH
jgi:hypothetical protein